MPRRRADLAALPLPRAPVGHRAVGLGLHALPGAVQRQLHRPRRARPARARSATTTRSTTAGSATRAASPTRRSTSTSASPQPLLRDGGELRPVTLGARARRGGRRRCAAPARAPARSPAARRPTRRASSLQRAAARARSARPTSTRAPAATLDRDDAARARARPALQATVPDLEFAHAVLVLGTEPDRRRADPRPAHPQGRAPPRRAARSAASARPTSLDRRAPRSRRYRAGRRRGLARRARRRARRRPARDVDELAQRRRRRRRRACARSPRALQDAGEDVVILWGERADRRPARRARRARAAERRRAPRASPAATARACSQIPSGANGRGLREAGVLPDAGPGLAAAPAAGPRRRRDRRRPPPPATLTALYLLHTDPVVDQPGRRARGTPRSSRRRTVIAHAGFLTDGPARARDRRSSRPSPTPRRRARSSHPDGRLQRLRRAIGRQGETRAEWQVLAELASAPGPRPRRAHRRAWSPRSCSTRCRSTPA